MSCQVSGIRKKKVLHQQAGHARAILIPKSGIFIGTMLVEHIFSPWFLKGQQNSLSLHRKHRDEYKEELIVSSSRFM
jgi:hypothetical protein